MMTKRYKAITLCRVSSFEQLSNASLSRQAEAVLKAAKDLDVDIAENGQWSGYRSSKAGSNYHRKDLKEMVDRCKLDSSIKYLLVDEVDRFMRSVDELFYFEVVFKQLGVTIYYVSQPELNSSDPMVKIMKAFEAFKGEASNTERIHKSIVGQAAAIRAGKYPYRPKPGYVKSDIPGVHRVNPDTGDVLRRVLIGVAEYRYSPTEALKILNDSDFMNGKTKIKMDKFRSILTDPYYAGVVEMNKQVVERNVHGVHDRMITMRQHEEIVKIMTTKKKNQKGPSLGGNPNYPLANLVTCNSCIGKSYPRFAGFNHGNGSKNGKIYQKYRCRSCKRYIDKAELHDRISNHIKRYKLSQENKTKLIAELESVWKRNESENAREISRLRLKVKAINDSIMRHVDALSYPGNEFMRDELSISIKSKKEEVNRLAAKIETLAAQTADEKTAFLKFALDKIDDFDVAFMTMSHSKRQLCKQLIFPDGFTIDSDNNVLTGTVSVFNRVYKIKIDSPEPEKSTMVRVRRL